LEDSQDESVMAHRRCDPLWQPRSYDHVLRTHQDLHRVADYIMANPIRRGLCDHVEEYPWSGIPQLIAFAPRRIDVYVVTVVQP